MQKNREKVRMYNALYVLAIILIAFIIFITSILTNSDADRKYETSNTDKPEQQQLLIKVYVTGEVVNPGMYDIELGARVDKAIEIAGGPTENADLEGVNLAKVLKDGEQVKVPALKKEKTSTGKSSVKSSATSNVNVNCCNMAEYMKVSGMTEEIAENIINYITTFGPIQNLEELKLVDGMTDSLYIKFKEYFVV